MSRIKSSTLSLKALNRTIGFVDPKNRSVEAVAPEAVPEAGVMSYRRNKAVPKRSQAPLYTFDPTKPFPKVGDQVAILHSSDQDQGGKAKLVRSGLELRTVTAVYMADSQGHSIRDHAGESWLVKPATKGPAQWETFVPKREHHG